MKNFFYYLYEQGSYYKHRLSMWILAILSCIISLNSNYLKGQVFLEEYLKEGLNNNESIKQQTFLLKKNMYSLKEARALFFPTLSLEGNYSYAKGGRAIELPIGDLLNPIYSTLNELSTSAQFSEVNNISEQLNPKNYYDSKIRWSLPIINSEIYYNQKIQKSAFNMQQLELQIYKRELVKDIKIAYYQFCQMTEEINIYENGVKLAKEGSRINESMFKNGKVNRSVVLRSENEVSKNEEKLFSAKLKLQNTQAYFNFLLNKPFDSHISFTDFEISDINKDEINEDSLGEREELQKLDFASKIYDYENQSAKSYYLPKMNAFFDIGSQGIDWRFNQNTRYYMVGVSLIWKLSLGGEELYKIKKSKANLEIIKSKQDEAERQLKLQLLTAINSYKEVVNSFYAIQKRLSAAQKYYKEVEKQFKEGMALYIEFLDAQNQFINTNLLYNISYYDIKIKYAEVERASASINLSNY
ncbi:TolC family protein [Apibacter sp. HY039]|uniref:TolC family protein n=1 Tax=Apibacter sp. HY039 TaxID=2501476 RepID=UPI0013E3752D|nr:TolC family protein [Apibacter sp. HY039]